MKSTNSKGLSSSKSKKSTRDRDKKKPQEVVNQVHRNKNADGDAATYSGVDTESLLVYANHCGIESLNRDISEVLIENINYKLRYILNDALLKTRLSGSNVISAKEIDQTFHEFAIEKVFGTNFEPTFVPFGDENLFYLAEEQINLTEIATKKHVFKQKSKTIVTQNWLPEKTVNPQLETYFSTICSMLLSLDDQVRNYAFCDVYRNFKIATIIPWFYNFVYVLLAKDYDLRMAINALELLEILEISPTCRIYAPEKQLHFIMRLILQRTLSSEQSTFLHRACNTLAVLCRRDILNEFVLIKVSQKLDPSNLALQVPIISLIIRMGPEAIITCLLPYMDVLLQAYEINPTPEMRLCLIELYCNLNKVSICNHSQFLFLRERLFAFNRYTMKQSKQIQREPVHFAKMKWHLIKTRRKVQVLRNNTTSKQYGLNEVFLIPDNWKYKSSDAKPVMNGHHTNASVIIGKRNNLLPIFKNPTKFGDNSMPLWYNL